MQPRKSEIFEAYAKLAEEKGLVKKASFEDKDGPELKKYKSDVYPRVGSDSISTIEALYGVKCDTIEGMEYDQNIAQVAHPNAVVLTQSYDKLNSLIENINERHNIIVNKIMSKAPSGSLLLLKDAQKELTMGLIRVANEADNADEEEIRQLADDCLNELNKTAGWWDEAGDWVHDKVKGLFGGEGDKALDDTKSVGKGALEGAAMGGIAAAIATAWFPPAEAISIPFGLLAGAVVGGLAAYLVNTGTKVKNIKENTTSLLNQLGDLKNSIPEESAFFTRIEDIADKLIKSSDIYLVALETIRTKEGKNEIASPSEIEEVKKDAKNFISLIDIFEKVKSDFDAKEKEGAFAKALNKTPGLDNDIDDVRKEFFSLAASIDNLKNTMNKWVDKAKEETSKVKEEVKPTVSTSIPVADKQENKPADKALQKSIADFVDQLGYKPSKENLDFINSFDEFRKK